MAERKRRANGEESRRRILAAAVEVATERGYDGTSIAAVSQKSGLPASSIYWHFANKEALFEAVLEDRFEVWMRSVTAPEGSSEMQAAMMLASGTADAFHEAPEFLRLGFMLVLERRPTELSARKRFLDLRDIGRQRLADFAVQLAPAADPAAVDRLLSYAIAAADGMFLAKQMDPGLDLNELFDLHAQLMIDALMRLGEAR
ncbi:TetR/AcrR family transcriptional regulator [Actinoplanes sp. TFC3]|uniref:TetR/AcrR family transcriptional regulator n=1 Tax=Actinoplanes sp. TFC3 TaxID=1710355 RepID=UPI000AE35A71|nr:TetR/AcrR family transcriptional regulator [Actinoplanes sp. TFC3]